MPSSAAIVSMRSIAAAWLWAAARAPSAPCQRSSSTKRSSSALARCAVVRPVCPPPLRVASRTTTERPSRCSSYATERPAMPAPITQTSAVVLLSSGGRRSASPRSSQGVVELRMRRQVRRKRAARDPSSARLGPGEDDPPRARQAMLACRRGTSLFVDSGWNDARASMRFAHTTQRNSSAGVIRQPIDRSSVQSAALATWPHLAQVHSMIAPWIALDARTTKSPVARVYGGRSGVGVRRSAPRCR